MRKSKEGFSPTPEGVHHVKFVLEVDMGEDAFAGNAADELGRILRYWGGNLRHYALAPGDGEAVYDSGFREVGGWRITAAPQGATEAPASPS